MKKTRLPFLTHTHWILIALSIVSATVALTATIIITIFAPTALVQQIVDSDYSFPIGAFIALIIIATGAHYATMIVGHELTFALIRAFRLFVYQHIVRVPLVVWHGWRHGDIVERLMRNLESLDGMLLRVVLPLVASSAVLVCWLIWMGFHTHSLVALLQMLFISLPIIYYFISYQSRLACIQERAGAAVDMRDSALEVSSARRVLQLFFAHDFVEQRLASSATRHTHAHQRTQHYAQRDAFYGRISIICVFATLVGWWNWMQPAINWQMIACLLSVVPVVSLSQRIIQSGQTWLVVAVAQSRITECMADSATPNTAHDHDYNHIKTQPSLAGRNLSFRYADNSEPIINDLSLACAAGTTTLIQGTSGIGKSTLLHLLAGYYTPQQGTVQVDGIDITTLSDATRKCIITFIPQSYPLLYCSLAESMRLARHDATASAMLDALDAVGLHTWYQALPDGMETILGQGAHGFSGGELRRFAVACALLRDTPIWLIDEPIAHLDERSRVHIADLINQHTANRTTLLVTHSHADLFHYQHRYHYHQLDK